MNYKYNKSEIIAGTNVPELIIDPRYLNVHGGSLFGPLNMQGFPILNIGSPETFKDAINLSYLIEQGWIHTHDSNDPKYIPPSTNPQAFNADYFNLLKTSPSFGKIKVANTVVETSTTLDTLSITGTNGIVCDLNPANLTLTIKGPNIDDLLVSSSLNSILSNYNYLNSSISTLLNDIASTNQTLTKSNEKIANLQDVLSNIPDIATILQDITNINLTIASLEDTTKALSNANQSNTVSIANMNQHITSLEEFGSSLQDSLNTANDTISNCSSMLSAINTSIPTLSASVHSLQAQNSSFFNSVTNTTTLITTLSQNVQNVNSILTGLSNDVTSLLKRITTSETTVNSMSSNISVITAKINESNTIINTTNSQILTVSNSLDKLNTFCATSCILKPNNQLQLLSYNNSVLSSIDLTPYISQKYYSSLFVDSTDLSPQIANDALILASGPGVSLTSNSSTKTITFSFDNSILASLPNGTSTAPTIAFADAPETGLFLNNGSLTLQSNNSITINPNSATNTQGLTYSYSTNDVLYDASAYSTSTFFIEGSSSYFATSHHIILPQAVPISQITFYTDVPITADIHCLLVTLSDYRIAQIIPVAPTATQNVNEYNITFSPPLTASEDCTLALQSSEVNFRIRNYNLNLYSVVISNETGYPVVGDFLTPTTSRGILDIIVKTSSSYVVSGDLPIKITNIATPISAFDAVNKNYVDLLYPNDTIDLSSITPSSIFSSLTGSITKISNLIFIDFYLKLANPYTFSSQNFLFDFNNTNFSPTLGNIESLIIGNNFHLSSDTSSRYLSAFIPTGHTTVSVIPSQNALLNISELYGYFHYV